MGRWVLPTYRYYGILCVLYISYRYHTCTVSCSREAPFVPDDGAQGQTGVWQEERFGLWSHRRFRCAFWSRVHMWDLVLCTKPRSQGATDPISTAYIREENAQRPSCRPSTTAVEVAAIGTIHESTAPRCLGRIARYPAELGVRCTKAGFAGVDDIISQYARVPEDTRRAHDDSSTMARISRLMHRVRWWRTSQCTSSRKFGRPRCSPCCCRRGVACRRHAVSGRGTTPNDAGGRTRRRAAA